MAILTGNYLSLFAGIAGFDLGLRTAFPETRCVGYVEIGIEAAEILAARIKEGSLDPAPIWSDMRTFPGQLYRGRVAGLIAGFPCPDYSVAGKRAGIVGKHGQLWDDLASTIRDLGEDLEWICLENVPGILVPHRDDKGGWVLPAGLWFVLGDISSLGFDAEWITLRASEVGASHGRNRWFCLAYRKGRGCGELRESSERNGLINGINENLVDHSWDEWDGPHGQAGPRRGVCETGNELVNSEDPKWGGAIETHNTGWGIKEVGGSGGERSLGNSNIPRLEGRDERGYSSGERTTGETGRELADTASRGEVPAQQRGQWSITKSRLPLFAPGPGATAEWQRIISEHPELAPAISTEEAERIVHTLANGPAATLAGSRTDQLRECGNAVVPLQCAAALRILVGRVGY